MQPLNTPQPEQNETTSSLVESLKKILLSEHSEQLQKIEQRMSQLENILQPNGFSRASLNPNSLAPIETHRLEGLAQNFQQLLRQESATRQHEINRINQQFSALNNSSKNTAATSIPFAEQPSPASEEKLAEQVNQVSQKMAQLIDNRITDLGEKMNNQLDSEIKKLKSETTQQFTTQLKATEDASLESLNQRLQKIADAALSNG